MTTFKDIADKLAQLNTPTQTVLNESTPTTHSQFMRSALNDLVVPINQETFKVGSIITCRYVDTNPYTLKEVLKEASRQTNEAIQHIKNDVSDLTIIVKMGGITFKSHYDLVDINGVKK